ncbi:hypothetical protein [Burkholderia sp. Cy-637]|uniref:hypothetical protein n=1 Tax=Burkholderia sp. Cy-637 TaxID=2608327 RepID=UPI001F034A5F|nr:hypothetical protein [Burkholderia sp. Cy-637]
MPPIRTWSFGPVVPRPKIQSSPSALAQRELATSAWAIFEAERESTTARPTRVGASQTIFKATVFGASCVPSIFRLLKDVDPKSRRPLFSREMLHEGGEIRPVTVSVAEVPAIAADCMRL